MPLELGNFLHEVQSVEKDEWFGVAAADDAISDDECSFSDLEEDPVRVESTDETVNRLQDECK